MTAGAGICSAWGVARDGPAKIRQARYARESDDAARDVVEYRNAGCLTGRLGTGFGAHPDEDDGYLGSAPYVRQTRRQSIGDAGHET